MNKVAFQSKEEYDTINNMLRSKSLIASYLIILEEQANQHDSDAQANFWGFKIVSNEFQSGIENIPSTRISKTRASNRHEFKSKHNKREAIEKHSKH